MKIGESAPAGPSATTTPTNSRPGSSASLLPGPSLHPGSGLPAAVVTSCEKVNSRFADAVARMKQPILQHIDDCKLRAAVRNNDVVDAAQAALRRGADPNKILAMAVEHEKVEVVDLMVKNGVVADDDLKNSVWQTFLEKPEHSSAKAFVVGLMDREEIWRRIHETPLSARPDALDLLSPSDVDWLVRNERP